MVRCDAVYVRVIVTEYNDQGIPIGERVSPDQKVFRASAPRFWEDIDAVIKKAVPAPNET